MSAGGVIRILLVEDDRSIGEPVAEELGREGFAVTWVKTGNEALAAGPVDVVLLDLGLPDLDGREVCRRLRAVGPVPIIVLTARDDEVERVILFENGADDYVLKPFGFRELVARIRAVHRRSTLTSTAAGPSHQAALVVDLVGRRAHVHGAELELSPKEFDLLALLAGEPGRARGREEIMATVWDANWWGPTKTLDVHIAGLRRKLGEPAWITTLRNVGYRLDPPVGADVVVIGST